MLIDQGAISGKIAKTVFDEMAATGRPPEHIVAEKELAQVSDSSALGKEIDTVLAAHPEEVDRYKGGQAKLLGFFVGQVMKATKGKANPQLLNQLLLDKLE
jgi:aspartyl-tRNA(Asn)/glutamyl-tRNA(Gln) amidotransferase subunit B